ncbi:ABC transporter permease [Pseudomonas aeruginosa]|uniref:ABC transporter permease n=1 Tax=Pseudomonas aeruginosa TaxID=287 RepID=UPI00106751FC|nr:ABC transporter permease [Pseudomonas aeruginosa]TEF02455.1 ABC transporter permease [Pseudomonas aeruginosa]TEF10177.1 ABC transporter permease [Pseudomonas aeruginosa]
MSASPSPRQLLHEALASLRGLGRRSLLALLGIVMGCSSVIAMLNIGSNATDEAMSIFKDMGTDTLVVQFPFAPQAPMPMPASLDTEPLLRDVVGLEHLAALGLYSAPVTFHGRTSNASIVGASAGLAAAARLRLREGRFLSRFDDHDTYVVVGATIAEALGAPGDPLRLGEQLTVNDYLFRVIGILQPQASAALLPFAANDSLFVPAPGMPRLQPAAEVSHVVARVSPGADVYSVGAALGAALTARLPGHEAQVQVSQQVLDGLKRQTRTFTYLLTGLGIISLLGGGVGVMNVMLMSVAERRREIGVRMALGARQRDIRNLFLIEAVTLTAAGALSGAVLGVAAAYLYARFSGWTFSLAYAALPLGMGSTLLVGLFFGLYPAVSAARLQPVEALRDE